MFQVPLGISTKKRNDHEKNCELLNNSPRIVHFMSSAMLFIVKHEMVLLLSYLVRHVLFLKINYERDQPSIFCRLK